jgi:hypothetical protein
MPAQQKEEDPYKQVIIPQGPIDFTVESADLSMYLAQKRAEFTDFHFSSTGINLLSGEVTFSALGVLPPTGDEDYPQVICTAKKQLTSEQVKWVQDRFQEISVCRIITPVQTLMACAPMSDFIGENKRSLKGQGRTLKIQSYCDSSYDIVTVCDYAKIDQVSKAMATMLKSTDPVECRAFSWDDVK